MQQGATGLSSAAQLTSEVSDEYAPQWVYSTRNVRYILFVVFNYLVMVIFASTTHES